MKKLLLVSVCFVACRQSAPPTQKTLSLQYIDSAVRPQDDFYRFANGKWLDTATIPPTEYGAGARWEMSDSTKAHIHSILENAASANAAPGSITQQVGDFYTAGMDTAAIDKRGYEPVKPYLATIDSIKDVKGILSYVASQTRMGYSLLIGQGFGPDDKNSRMAIAIYGQAGIGLPDRDYYFKTDKATLAVVAAYKTYLSTLFALTGDKNPAADVERVYAIEQKMAAAHKTQAELMDPEQNYHKMAVRDVQKAMPVLGWPTLLEQLGVHADSINLPQPGYYQALNKLLVSLPLDDWKLYLRAHTLDNAANELSYDFENASYLYYNKTIDGQQQIKPRWERVYGTIDATLGEALGQLYVQQYFPPEAKQRIAGLVDNLQKAFATRIDHLDWMSDSTKARAKEKLFAFIKKVGYPDKWKDYSKVVIQKDHYFESVQSALQNRYRYNLAKVGQPVDRTEWGMTPPTNNAYYNPTTNEICFPSGILTYPMFDVRSDDALNYGGIGMVIGHEMTHGFDDQGAQYDKDGNLKSWWTKEDYARFKAKCARVIRLYNGFTVLDSLHVNGQVTQGENTADIGGLAIAYDAFKLTPEGRDTTRIDGFTPDQRFFLSFAQTWRKKVTDAALRKQVNTDPHSPGNYRVRGAVTSNAAFYQAFRVVPGDKMYLADTARAAIW
jgi:putative endopeptidase